MLKTEIRFSNVITRHYLFFGAAVILLLAILMRFFARDFISGDYEVFLLKWFEQMKDNGGLSSLANYPGDYNAPYMTLMALMTYLPLNPLYMIKTVSIIFDVILAIACVLLVREMTKERSSEQRNLLSILIFGATLFLPSVFLNSGFWGQCDSIYASFVIFSIYFIVRNKYIPAFVMLGIAFAFKFQTIFILPFFLILYFTKRTFSILNFLIIPFVDFILCIPALLFGWPIKNMLLVYIGQAGSYDYKLTFNFPNIYNIITGNVGLFTKVGICLVLAVCIGLLIFCIQKKTPWKNEELLSLAIVSMLLIALVMPKMHERYMFICEVLGVVYLITYRKVPLLAFISILVPLITYSSYLFGLEYNALVLSLGELTVGGYVATRLLKTIDISKRLDK